MKRVITLMAIAGLASMASAQTAMVHIDAVGLADGDTVNVGDTVTWEVSISFTGREYLFGANIQVNATGGAASVDTILSQGSSVGAGTTFNAGLLMANGIDDIRYSDLPRALGSGGVGDNPFILGSFTTTATAVGSFSFAADQGTASSTAAIIIASGGLLTGGSDEVHLADASVFGQMADTINVVVPTPGSVALLGLGGLVATRRRR